METLHGRTALETARGPQGHEPIVGKPMAARILRSHRPKPESTGTIRSVHPESSGSSSSGAFRCAVPRGVKGSGVLERAPHNAREILPLVAAHSDAPYFAVRKAREFWSERPRTRERFDPESGRSESPATCGSESRSGEFFSLYGRPRNRPSSPAPRLFPPRCLRGCPRTSGPRGRSSRS